MLYTPGITKNLISVGTLTDLHKTLVFRSNGCFIIDNATLRVETFAPRENGKGLYKLTGCTTLVQPEAHLACSHSQATLWHKRLGHFHTKGLQRMARFDAVTGLPPLQFTKHTCTGCQFGKHTRTRMPKSTKFSTSHILQLIHSDVCGPFRTTSLGGHRYFVTFIDDYSRRMWIYFISNKSEVLQKFQHFVHLMETSTGQKVQALRSDNGGEYISHAFSTYCSAKGISREIPPPYTPERNGVAERRNRSLLDITRCMLIDKSLPGYLWAEAVRAAADILNLRSTKQHPDKTPDELFFGKKPTVRHLRVFGSPVFVHIPKVSRSKLAPRSEQCILLSFDISAKAYRCFRPSTRKVFPSRDIRIDETTPPSSSLPNDPIATSQDFSFSAPTSPEESRPSSSPPIPPSSVAQEDNVTSEALPLSPSACSQSPPPSQSPTHADIPQTPSSTLSDSSLDVSPSFPSPLPAKSPLNPQLLSRKITSSPSSVALPRRSERIRQFPKHLHDFAANIQLQPPDDIPEDSPTPVTFKQAQLNPLWRSAIYGRGTQFHPHQQHLVPCAITTQLQSYYFPLGVQN